MYGRICQGLLAAFFLPASLIAGQTVESRRIAPDSFCPTNSRDAGFRANRQTKTRGAVGSVPLSRTVSGSAVSGSTVLPAPIHEPFFWRPLIYSSPSGFAQLARRAGIIFSGTVTRIEHPAETPGQAVGTVAITFHVDNAIRGATASESVTITQWIGLWSSGQRYRIGERLFLFLYPPSRVGLTSCVGATMGRFAVDSSGSIRLSPEQILAFRTDPVLGGKSQLHLSDFASAVRRAGEEE
jgi:hypothetical protein